MGEVRLTEYALTHMDECALSFSYIKEVPSDDFEFSFGYVNREKASEKHRVFNPNYTSTDLIYEEIEPSVELQEQADALNLVMKLNGTIGQDISQLMTIHKCSNQTLGNMSGIDKHRIHDIRHGIRIASKREVLAISASLELHPRVIYHLLSKIGCNITTSYLPEDMCYDFLIKAYADKGIDAWNAFLAEANKHEWHLPYPA